MAVLSVVSVACVCIYYIKHKNGCPAGNIRFYGMVIYVRSRLLQSEFGTNLRCYIDDVGTYIARDNILENHGEIVFGTYSFDS